MPWHGSCHSTLAVNQRHNPTSYRTGQDKWLPSFLRNQSCDSCHIVASHLRDRLMASCVWRPILYCCHFSQFNCAQQTVVEPISKVSFCYRWKEKKMCNPPQGKDRKNGAYPPWRETSVSARSLQYHILYDYNWPLYGEKYQPGNSAEILSHYPAQECLVSNLQNSRQ